MNSVYLDSDKKSNISNYCKQYEALFERINFMINYLQEIHEQNSVLSNKINKIEHFINNYISKNTNQVKKQNQAKESKHTQITNHKAKKNEIEQKITQNDTINDESPSKCTNEIQKSIIIKKITKVNKDESPKIKITKKLLLIKEKSKEVDNDCKEITIKKAKTKVKEEEKPKQKQKNNNKVEDQTKTIKKKVSRLQRSIINRENDKSFHRGYMGEAYIYEHLNQMGCFSKIEWNASTSDQNNPSITTKDGSVYFIQEDGDHYDIYAEDYENQKYYFEIKSTEKNSRGNHISSAQKNYFDSLDQKNTYFVLAKVMNVFNTPIIEYNLYIPNVGFKKIDIDIDKNKKYFIKKELEFDEDISDKSKDNNVSFLFDDIINSEKKKTIKNTKKNGQSSMSFLLSKNLKQLKNKEKSKSKAKANKKNI